VSVIIPNRSNVAAWQPSAFAYNASQATIESAFANAADIDAVDVQATYDTGKILSFTVEFLFASGIGNNAREHFPLPDVDISGLGTVTAFKVSRLNAANSGFTNLITNVNEISNNI
jgi:hypothetical protein